MSTRVFIGNLPWSVASDGDMMEALTQAGAAPGSCRLITDKESGRSRGFGFAEYGSPQAAKDAIEVLNGYRVDGRPLRADYATERSRSERRPDDRGRSGDRGNDDRRRGGRGGW
jgi:RNA recognition motif-containing protein